MLEQLGKHDEAMVCYNKAVEINPQHSEAVYHKGRTLAQLGNYDDAIECYNNALKINPQYSEA